MVDFSGGCLDSLLSFAFNGPIEDDGRHSADHRFVYASWIRTCHNGCGGAFDVLWLGMAPS